jgi:hypothetical protein
MKLREHSVEIQGVLFLLNEAIVSIEGYLS